MLKESQDQRKASSQFSLNDLIDRLEELPQDMPILLGEAESYRGYYMDLAFVPLGKPRTVKEALDEAEVRTAKPLKDTKAVSSLWKATLLYGIHTMAPAVQLS